MARLVDVAAVNDLVDGTMKMVAVDGKELVLARVGEEFFAADERCPHMGGRLSKGMLSGTIIVCPRHGSRFDLRDGRVARWTEATGLALTVAKAIRHPRPLRIYPVRVEEGRVLVDPEPAEQAAGG